MLKKVLWIALACAVLLAVLAISRGVKPTAGTPKAPPVAPAAEESAAPVVEQAPAPQPTAPPVPTPEELQVQEDAAAVGLTTIEPEAEPAPETPAETPPQN